MFVKHVFKRVKVRFFLSQQKNIIFKVAKIRFCFVLLLIWQILTHFFVVRTKLTQI